MVTTTTVNELLERKREIEERKLRLQKYDMKLRKIISRIGEITYRKCENREQEKLNLEAQKRTIAAELKAGYNLTPARIPYQLREYDHALFEINRKLSNIEQQAIKQTQPEKPQEQPEPDSARQRLEALENRLTETGVQLLSRQESREPSGAYGLSSPPRSASGFETAKGRAALPQQPEQSQDDRDR